MSNNPTVNYVDYREIHKYLQEVKKHKPLTRVEENVLIHNIKNGCEDSKKALIYANLRYVITMAKQYRNQGLDLSDLISEGNYGLIKAAERFNYEQTDVRFLSYAVWWIKQSIIQSLNENSRTIRLPVNIINDSTKQNKTNPSEFEAEPVQHPLISRSGIVRLDSELNENTSMYDIIEDENTIRPDIKFSGDHENLLSKLSSVLSTLTDMEKYIIIKYFGLDGEPITLQEISTEVNLTKERVRQIKEKALKRLRHHSKELFNLL